MGGISRTRRTLALLIVVLGAFAPFAVAEVTNSSIRSEANVLFEEGKYEEALAKYSDAVADGMWTPNLFYNLANTEYRLKNSGQAVLNYERALALEPAHPEARRNLELVRSQTGAKLFQPRWWEQLFPAWRADIYAITAAVCVWLLLFALAFLWLRRTRSRLLWWGIATLGLLVGAYSSAALWLDWQRNDLGVVTRSGTVARFAPADRAEVAQNLPEGSQVRVLSERGAWIYCALPGNELGWLPAQSLERVRIIKK
jgi:tetratricopeptide (TPR) repeat protein